ncbi:hypothetical protein GCM10009624_18600 [Gordonia sinesedis]
MTVYIAVGPVARYGSAGSTALAPKSRAVPIGVGAGVPGGTDTDAEVGTDVIGSRLSGESDEEHAPTVSADTTATAATPATVRADRMTGLTRVR